MAADRVMTLRQVAAFLGVSLSTIYRLVNLDPGFPVFRIRGGLYVRESKLLEWIAAQEAKGH